MEKNNNECVVCAAIWYNDHKQHPQQSIYDVDEGFVICGYRHPNIISVCPTNPHYDSEVLLKIPDDTKCTQGFIINNGRFVDRIEAAKIAYKANQIDSWWLGRELYSEDLY